MGGHSAQIGHPSFLRREDPAEKIRMTGTLKPFEVHESGALFHGTKAALAVGDLLLPGRLSNFEEGRTSNHVYLTATLDAAAWGAELAAGESRGRIYIVE